MTSDLDLDIDDLARRQRRQPEEREISADPLAELAPWLAYVDHALQRRLARQQQRSDDRFDMQGILIPFDELDDLSPPPAAPRWLHESDQGPVVFTPPLAGRLAQLAERFRLSRFEIQALVLSLLPLFEPRYGPMIAYLQGDEQGIWAGVDLAASLFAANAAERIAHRGALGSPSASLRRHSLVHSVERSGRMSSHGDATYLRGADSVFHYLTGRDDALPKPLLDAGAWLTRAGPALRTLSADWAAFAQRLANLCFDSRRAATPVLLLQGGDGREALLAELAELAGTRAFGLNLEALPDDAEDAWPVLLAALHHTRLTGSLLVLRELARFEARHDALREALDARLADHGQPVVGLVSADEPTHSFTGVPRLVLTMPARSREDDVALVQASLDGMLVAPGALPLASLLRRTRINPDALASTLAEAELYRRQRDPAAPLSEADLHAALRVRAQQHFGPLAQRIAPRRGLGDLIAGDALLEQLQEILAAIRQREAVLAQGFARKVAYGTGISALFYGESGTGKSMAAEVLAGELGVDLIRVDLATVVNKYIGETEKNLSKIFDLATADSGVLLFDEADALFGKRSEVKDAHDRHANIEVSYLLQRLEHYPGLVVLSTNNRGHLDEAFTRRLTFMTRFEAPDAALRERMWRAIWPSKVVIDGAIDWRSLAERTELTGAGIRNVALLASWLAADAKRPVMQTDIERAVRRELAKTGRLQVRRH